MPTPPNHHTRAKAAHHLTVAAILLGALTGVLLVVATSLAEPTLQGYTTTTNAFFGAAIAAFLLTGICWIAASNISPATTLEDTIRRAQGDIAVREDSLAELVLLARASDGTLRLSDLAETPVIEGEVVAPRRRPSPYPRPARTGS